MPAIKIQLLSDLHNDKLNVGLLEGITRDEQADILVVAGDIEDGTTAIKGLQKLSSASRPVVVVFGNNCVRGERIDLLEERAKELSQPEIGFHVLHRRSVILHGIRILGAILWTDGNYIPEGVTRESAHTQCASKGYDKSEESPGVPFSFQGSMREHIKDLSFLQRELDTPFKGPTVVVTHHLPSPECADRRFKSSPAATAYASFLNDRLFEQCDLWLHGHTHSSVDIQKGRCRIVANPRGTSKELGKWGNPDFKERMILEVAA